jgi:hypothetical protein
LKGSWEYPGAKIIALESNYFFAFGHRDTGGSIEQIPPYPVKKGDCRDYY